MSNIVNFKDFKKKKVENDETPPSDSDNEGSTFDDVIKKNQENLKRIKRARDVANKNIIKYRDMFSRW